jgi:colicin import membrane protein
VAAADAADAAEQRAIEEILALEEALKSAKAEAERKRADLEQRLAESDERASAAVRERQAAHAKLKELERSLAEAKNRGRRPEPATLATPPPGESGSGGITHEDHEARLAAELRLRTEELEREREEKTRLIEKSDRQLAEIEERAAEAAQRVATAEAELAQEAERLRTEAERAQENASVADARVRDLQHELEQAREEGLPAAGAQTEASAEERTAAIAARIVHLAWVAWRRWGAPLLASIRSLIRSGTSQR